MLAAVGAIVGIAAWPLAARAGGYPTLLTVSDAELTLGHSPEFLRKSTPGPTRRSYWA